MGQYMKSKLSAICRLTVFLSLLGMLSLSNSSIYAQSETEGQPLLRGARLPASSSDTGAAFDEMEHLRAAGEFFKARATSGDVKDWGEVLRIGYDEWSKLGNSIAFKTEGTSAWQQVAGPLADNNSTPRASGRTRDIAFDPTNTSIGYVAAAQGGIWKTTDLNDAQPVWISISDNKLPTCAMGAIAVDPNNGSILYAGTGEVDGGYSTPPGFGIYKSTDGGNNWTNVAATSVAGTTCGQIVVDPSNSQHVLAATGNGTGGLLVSMNGGGTWTKVTTAGSDPTSIAMDPSNSKNIFVGCQSGGVYRSQDGGATFAKCTITGGTGSLATTIVAISPSSTNYIYACISDGAGYQGIATYGIAMSSDAGTTWTVVNKCNDAGGTKYAPNAAYSHSSANQFPHCNFLYNQGHYGNSIVVSPSNPLSVIVGGIDVWSSSDNGATLNHIGYWTDNFSSNNYIHADIHRLVFHNNILYACTDGGLGTSNSNGQSWLTTANHGLSTLQFVGADANEDFTYVLAGAQDNGVCRASSTAPGQFSSVFQESRGGDAGIQWISPSDGLTCYSTYVYATFYKSADGGQNWPNASNGGAPNDAQNYITNTALLNESAPFYPTWDADPSGNVVAYGGNSKIYVDQSGGNHGFTDGVSKQAIGASIISVYNDQATAWAGNNSGKVYRCYDLYDAVSTWTPSSTVGSGAVTGITADPNNPATVYCVLAGSGSKHFYASADTGKTWTAPDATFPNVPCNSLDRDADGNLYVGTDFGVLSSTDSGKTWSALGQGLPICQVLRLKVKEGANGRYLLASTYGRGVYYLTSPLSVSKTNSHYSNIASLDQSFPNPLSISGGSKATVGFTLQKNAVTQITLHDVVGRQVQVLSNQFETAGHHTVQFDATNLAAGTYICALTTSGVTLTEKITVVK
jgi:photosystem II stability/assembly factor-like uncharacterized protein